MRVFDLAAGGGGAAEVLRVSEAHSRAVHSLALAGASAHADVPPASLDCFLTASTDGVTGAGTGSGGTGGMVRLWDLRTARCARQLAGAHSNRSRACGIALSPDGIYVATGSEDRSAWVYDLRTGGAAARLRGATDSVTAVAWHPRMPLLAAGSLDGGLRFYRPGAGDGEG